MGTRAVSSCRAAVLCVLLAGCGGGGGVQSTPAPAPPPSSPTPTLAPVNYDTAEYRNSDGPVLHNAISAYNAGASGAGVTVGIVDTGIDVDNPEFAGRISPLSAAFNGQGSIQDQEGHGTAVATILAAARNGSRTMGMSWGSTIMALRTEDPTNCPASSGCTHPDIYIAAAIDHARLNGAKVINVSLGGGSSSVAVRAAVSRATAAGIVIAVSAGNDSAASPDGFAIDLANPSVAHGLVIIATSINADGSHSSFANGAQGYETTALSALGDRVLAQDQNGVQGLWSGTSMSTPQVAGAIALMLQAFPNLTPQRIVSRLLSTAQDAGAPGADGAFGMGILDLAAAFAPGGATTLGTSTTPISLTQNGTLGSAMGDASGATPTKVVVIDAMGRAYSLAVQQSFAPEAAQAVLRRLHEVPAHTSSFGTGGFAGSISFAGSTLKCMDRFGEPMLSGDVHRIAARLSMRLGPSTSLGMALRARPGLQGAPATADFLAARQASDSFGFEAATETAVALEHDFGHGWRLDLSGEEGGLGQRGKQPDNDRYRQVSSALSWSGGRLSFSVSGTMMKEPSTLLGARLAPFFAVRDSTTFFADMRLFAPLSPEWSLDLSARRGWTRADGGGARLRTLAWSASVARSTLLLREDHFAVRIAQPLRLTHGGVDAMLPVAHDYATGRDDWRMTRVDLSPRGREIDGEIAWSAPLAGGRVTVNSYWRRQPGNVAWAPDDLGGAIRFSVGY